MSDYGSTKPDGWQPSVKYLLVLIFAEILIMGALRTYTKHGG